MHDNLHLHSNENVGFKLVAVDSINTLNGVTKLSSSSIKCGFSSNKVILSVEMTNMSIFMNK
jgi:hypothetical protein